MYTKKSPDIQKIFTSEFIFQPIIGVNYLNCKWVEMLYRPAFLNGHSEVVNFFESLNDRAKTSFDINALNKLCRFQHALDFDRFSLNIFPSSLKSNVFLKRLKFLFDHEELIPEKLCLEITEHEAIDDLSVDCINLLKKLREAGAWIALDDFGSGHSHWSLIKLDLINVLKVVNQNIDSELINSSYLESLFKFGRSLGLLTVLEGIETSSDYHQGKQLGFDFFQGFLFHEQ